MFKYTIKMQCSLSCDVEGVPFWSYIKYLHGEQALVTHSRVKSVISAKYFCYLLCIFVAVDFALKVIKYSDDTTIRLQVGSIFIISNKLSNW